MRKKSVTSLLSEIPNPPLAWLNGNRDPLKSSHTFHCSSSMCALLIHVQHLQTRNNVHLSSTITMLTILITRLISFPFTICSATLRSLFIAPRTNLADPVSITSSVIIYSVSSAVQTEKAVYSALACAQALQTQTAALPADDPRNSIIQKTAGIPGNRSSWPNWLLQILQTAKQQFRRRSCSILPTSIFIIRRC